MGAQDGSYPATGFHTRGEMGGFWTPPIKLLDGIWFKAGDTWLTASRYTSGWGYQRMDLGTHDGVRITRTDFAPDGIRAGLIGLRLDTTTATTLPLAVDAHSELMKAYPWGETTPSQTTYNLQDTGAVNGKNLVFREQGTPPATNARRTTTPPSSGSQPDPERHRARARPPRAAGRRRVPGLRRGHSDAAGPLRRHGVRQGHRRAAEYDVAVPKGGRTVWFAIGGSDHGLAEAQSAQQHALANPGALLRQKIAARNAIDGQHQGEPAR